MIRTIRVFVHTIHTSMLRILIPGLQIGRDVEIRHSKIRRGKTVIGRGCRLGPYVILEPSGGHIDIGEYAFINSFSTISGMGGICIGDFVAIEPRCSLVASNHVFDNPRVYIKKQGRRASAIVIEDDVWLGTGVTVLDGVRIGRGSVVGAGSVVSHSLPPNSIAVGVPARIIRDRGATAAGPSATEVPS